MKRPPISLTDKLALNNPFRDLYFFQESKVFVDVETCISDFLTSIFLSKSHLHVNGDEIIDHADEITNTLSQGTGKMALVMLIVIVLISKPNIGIVASELGRET